MATVEQPTTESPGKLAILYSYSDSNHQASVNYIAGVDMNGGSAIAADALELATAMAQVFTNAVSITGWKTLTQEGATLLVGSFSAALVGTHSHNTNDSPYKSHTLKILGRGAAVDVLAGSGVCSLLMFIRDSYDPIPGQKYMTFQIDAPLTALMSLLNSNLRYWADFYGQHANTTGKVAVQFNAHAQKRLGS